MIVKGYKDLIAYKKSYQLVREVYLVTKDFPRDERYGVVSQLRRAAVSIPSNIAEGYMRGSKEYTHFLRIALGSAAEVETLLNLSSDLNLSGEKLIRAKNLNQESIRLLVTYIKGLSKR